MAPHAPQVSLPPSERQSGSRVPGSCLVQKWLSRPSGEGTSGEEVSIPPLHFK